MFDPGFAEIVPWWGCAGARAGARACVRRACAWCACVRALAGKRVGAGRRVDVINHARNRGILLARVGLDRLARLFFYY